jgi:hypothetical protein
MFRAIALQHACAVDEGPHNASEKSGSPERNSPRYWAPRMVSVSMVKTGPLSAAAPPPSNG